MIDSNEKNKVLNRLRAFREMISSKITEDGMEILAEEITRFLNFSDFQTAIEHFSKTFEPKPLKTFPTLKDFLEFKMSENKTWLQKFWSFWADKLGLEIEIVRNYPFWKLEAAYKLNKKPWELPKNGSELTDFEKNTLDIPEECQRKAFFNAIKEKIKNLSPNP